jgi:hypothetical protein
MLDPVFLLWSGVGGWFRLEVLTKSVPGVVNSCLYYSVFVSAFLGVAARNVVQPRV